MSTHQPPDGTGSGRIRHLLLVGAGTALWGLTALLAFSSKALLLVLLLGSLALMSTISAGWIVTLASGDGLPVDIFTAGTEPPFAINLRMGLAEAVLTLLINMTGLLAALYLRDTLFRQGRRAMAVLLIFTMASCGIVLTRDLFNLFVFFELVASATGGLILLSRDIRALGAGFKFLVASQVVTILLLVGIIFSYHATGTLNIDGMAEVRTVLMQGRLPTTSSLIGDSSVMTSSVSSRFSHHLKQPGSASSNSPCMKERHAFLIRRRGCSAQLTRLVLGTDIAL